ncbi:MAG: choice-of-anchor tandem repeat GloVer-containing protein [Terriglobales bacterium]
MKTKDLWSDASKIFGVLALILISSISVPAQQEKILHTFIVSPRGANPQGNLTADVAGNLYGTTQDGGIGSGCAPDGCGTVFKLTRASDGNWVQTVLHYFGSFSGDGAQPAGGVIFDAAGNLYGTTISGGSSASSCGTVFELSPGVSGRWTESILYSFAGGPYGCGPATGLVFDRSGNLYGPAGQTVFELTPSSTGTWTETVLYTFSGQTDGGSPNAVVLDQAGNVYGSAVYGGNVNCNPSYNDLGCGVVFELIRSGNTWSEKVLHTFNFNDGAFPLGNLIFDAEGGLLGTTANGPGTACNSYGCGTVFRLRPRSDGSWVHAIIHNFEGGRDGASPAAGLTLEQGVFFGTTQFGGTGTGQGFGTVFELIPQHPKTWTEHAIHRFAEGDGPVTNVIFDSTGNLYGSLPWSRNPFCSAIGGTCGAVFKMTQSSDHRWKSMQVYAFNGSPVGAIPEGGLIADDSGNFYGTASNGGTYENGSAFELTPKTGGGWNIIALHSFARNNDGSEPEAGLIFDTSGNLYGTTSGGIGCYGGPCGTVFRLSPSSRGWKETVLYRFKGGTDGSLPLASVVLDEKGNIYGTTAEGGSSDCGGGCGTVFKLSPNSDGSWTETLIHVFHNETDGQSPQSSLVFDDAGNLYGTTVVGGGLLYGAGTVFKMTTNSNGVWSLVTLYTFTGKQDGGFPVGLTLGTDGDLYGVTRDGGNSKSCEYACGTIFRLARRGTSSWTEKVLHSFQGGNDGAGPVAPPTFDSYGNLYGTTTTDGNEFDCGSGTIYELSSSSHGWTERVLHNFGNYFNTSDGSCPWGGVILDASGNIFGTTAGGGTDIVGTIFEVSPAGEPSSPVDAGKP